VAGGFLNTLRSTYDFFRRYAQEWRPPAEEDATPPDQRPSADRWLLARLDEVVTTVRQSWSAYDVTAGVRAIMDFVGEDLSRWYVRRNRPRFWAPDRATDPVALETLHEALVTAVRLLAPAAPFIADSLHRSLTGVSVHLAPFPVDRGHQAPELLTAMNTVRRLASLARAARETHNLRVRQPLARMQLAVPAGVQGPALSDLLDILAAEVNVKSVQVVASDHDLVRLRGKANFRTLGKRYAKDTPKAAAAVTDLGAEELQALERGETVRAGGWELRPEDVTVTREVASDWLVQADGPYVVALDPALTEDLIQEGLAREVVNRVQRLRKEAGYEYTTRIELSITGAEEVVAATRAFQGFVEGETLARRLELDAVLDEPDLQTEVEIQGRPQQEAADPSREAAPRRADARHQGAGPLRGVVQLEPAGVGRRLVELLLPHGGSGHRRHGARKAVPVRVAGRPLPLAPQRGAPPPVWLARAVRQMRAMRRRDRLRPPRRPAARAAVHQVQGERRRWKAPLSAGCFGARRPRSSSPISSPS
jgi:isoleucyl-tRNA synthetase